MIENPVNKDTRKDASAGRNLVWKRKLLVFSFFLAISIVIWLLNALSKNYSTEIKYPITYSRFPARKILVNELPNHLNLTVNAHGYALLSYKLINRPVPINFAVSSYTMNMLNRDTTRFYLLTNYAREEVGRQLPSELQLMEIAPDSLIFQFANLTKKTVKVEPDLDYSIKKDFIIKRSVQIKPESVLVSGPDIFLDTLTAIGTKKLNLGELEKNYAGVLKLIDYPKLKYTTSDIECEIEIEKLTEIQLQVPVHIANLPDSIRMQTFPHFIRVSGKIGLSNYERIVPEAFWIEVDYNEVLEKKSRLQVEIKSAPEELISISYYPQSVEYLLSVK
ncbi:MAG: hypothetical protein K9J30_12310 [Bacteroidales bacterium]|nr:hypothetical protein [Bacteroidales bacterium]